MPAIEKLLVANRGEIASRIIRTAHKLGIETVAVFSKADIEAPFVAQADEAICIGPARSSASYLNIDSILRAAVSSGANAVHPGYGFLSENAEFARRCEAAGLIFVGPSAEAIELLGSKQVSKALAVSAQVATLQNLDLKDPKLLPYPVLLKASAGGGGKGMQIVRKAGQLSEALASAKRIAKSSFDDETILCERYIEKPRHIEVQVLADLQGNAVFIGQRDCSIQRRHQKIVEECPPPFVSEEICTKMGKAALRIVAAANYCNAGTVEFLLAESGEFYFLEVNTRLQVEHPVTELVYDIDLVEEQLRIASGEILRLTQDSLVPRGNAIEVRLYAEDCNQNFLPATGTMSFWEARLGSDVRLDSGIEAGSEVGIHYDPMLAKLIAWGNDRQQARLKLARALRDFVAVGVTTNISYLRAILKHPDFVGGNASTAFIETNHASLTSGEVISGEVISGNAIPVLGDASPGDRNDSLLMHAAVAAALFAHRNAARTKALLPALAPGFRNSRWRHPRYGFTTPDSTESRSFWIEIDQASEQARVQLVLEAPGPTTDTPLEGPVCNARLQARTEANRFTLEINGHLWPIGLYKAESGLSVHIRGELVVFHAISTFPILKKPENKGACTSPMPGTVVAIHAKRGDVVEEGQLLIILEAMKMEHRIVANEQGKLLELLVEVGSQVEADAIVARVAPLPIKAT